MTTTKISFEQTEDVTFHGTEVEATKQQIESVLGAPDIDYSDTEGKSRTEWDEAINGVAVKVFDHHHYGQVTETTEVSWSIEAADGSAALIKGRTGEYIGQSQQPTPTEIEVKQEITANE